MDKRYQSCDPCIKRRLKQVECGSILTMQIPAGVPFGGYKQSGIGRETHKVILEHYTQMKNIMINLSEVSVRLLS